MAFAASAGSVGETDILSMYVDVILGVAIERSEQFGEAGCKGITVSVIRFLGVAEGIDDSCEGGVHVATDFSTNSLVRDEQNPEGF